MLSATTHTALKQPLLRTDNNTARTQEAPRVNKNDTSEREVAYNFDFNFRDIGIQPKLKVNAPNDVYEQEADRIAQKVIQMKDVPSIQGKDKTAIHRKPLADEISQLRGNTTQRKCSKCNDEDEEHIQRKSSRANVPQIPSSFSDQLSATRGGGTSLDSTTNSFMSSRFGVDFSNVKIHNDSKAHALSQGIQAKAFTRGSDIYFSQGAYVPRTQDGKELLAHELVHTVQQAGFSNNNVQRRSFGQFFARLFGEGTFTDKELEEYLDFLKAGNAIEDKFDSDNKARAVVRRWKAGTLNITKEIKVLLIKEMLSGATLNEDENAIIDLLKGSLAEHTYILSQLDLKALQAKFQGEEAETLKATLLPAPKPDSIPSTMPKAEAEDFKIDRVRESSLTQYYFKRDSDQLTKSAEAQIDQLKNTAPKKTKVIGYASLDEVPSIAQKRADSVKSRLTSGKDAVKVTSAKGNAGATATRSDFARARKAEAVIGKAKSSTIDCKKKKKGKLVHPPKQACKKMDPATESDFKKALPLANNAMDQSLKAIDPKTSEYNEPLILKFFGTTDASHLSQLKINLSNLRDHVQNLPKITNCGGQCDVGGCEKGSIAYNNDVDAKSKMTLCVPIFKRLKTNDQVRNLIHESAHGTTPLGGPKAKKEGTKDVGYRHERMLFKLSPEDKMRNSDSYALFALYAKEIKDTKNPNAVPKNIATPSIDKFYNISKVNEEALQLVLAQSEKRMSWAQSHMSQVFAIAQDIHKGKNIWHPKWWARDIMERAAQLFPLTVPPASPTKDDIIKMAAILERYTLMKYGMKRDLKFLGREKGIMTWLETYDQVGLANDIVEVGPEFFKATPSDQITIFIQHLAGATRDVEKKFIPAYAALAEFIHKNA